MDEVNESVEVWSTSGISGNFEKKILGVVPANVHPMFTGIFNSWKSKEPFFAYELKGDDLKKYYRKLSSYLSYPDQEIFNEREIIYTFFFPEGSLNVVSQNTLTEDECNLTIRFAKVFGLVYRRFLDLKQAEQLARQAELDLVKLKEEKRRTEEALSELKAAQAQLIQSEKMASLGELTAGIAHEIQNPLNFVNNFAEVCMELIDEMKQQSTVGGQQSAVGGQQSANEIMDDIRQNLEKINHHGKRADAIVKGMLQHSRTSSGLKEPTDINALADEYLRLAYHGLRAKDKDFNATLKTDFDESIGKINIIPQDIGRVILNLITNAFYAADEKKKQLPSDLTEISNQAGQSKYEPTVTVSSKRSFSPEGEGRGEVLITVQDNGNGIPQNILDKIFQPFFTTKPTGEGTGLGLSLSYDIVKAHGGRLKVETKEGEGTTFIMQIPILD
jgi:signal transduction histidine kinase